jgi:hypothetical protein
MNLWITKSIDSLEQKMEKKKHKKLNAWEIVDHILCRFLTKAVSCLNIYWSQRCDRACCDHWCQNVLKNKRIRLKKYNILIRLKNVALAFQSLLNLWASIELYRACIEYKITSNFWLPDLILPLRDKSNLIQNYNQ